MSKRAFYKLNNQFDRYHCRKFVIDRLHLLGVYFLKGRDTQKNKSVVLEKAYFYYVGGNPTADYLNSKKNKRSKSYLEKRLSKQEEGKIYFAGNLKYKLVKIGFSTNPFNRVKSLQTGCPFKLTLFHSYKGTEKQEKELHKQFTDLRMNGEWFKLDGALKKYLYQETSQLSFKFDR